MKCFYPLCFTLLFLVSSVDAQQDSSVISTSAPSLSVQINDITPRFLRFYDSAASVKADPNTRWQLWRRMYGFAAVPPGPAGQTMARALLDSAWPNYPAHIARIRQGASMIHPAPIGILRRVADLLQVDTLKTSIKVILIVFVGALDNNAFTTNFGSTAVVAIPVETEDKKLELFMTHEFTHAVRSKIIVRPTGYIPSVAEVVMDEGVAMRVTENLIPGQPAGTYTNGRYDSWLQEAQLHQKEILLGIRSHLTDTAASQKSRFIFGAGTTGLEREAYYAGWVLIGELEKQGLSLAQLARLSPEAMIRQLQTAIDSLTR
jgi:hypothetical protein